MAKKTKETQPYEQHRCRECEEAYDWHSNDIHGNPILCRCKHYEDGVWCKLLNDKACRDFKQRQL